MVVERCHIFLVRLDPATGAETAKTRPCVVVSPDELNRAVSTVRRRSAEWHSAVSRIGSPQRLATSYAHRLFHALPNAIRRNSRVTLCATSSRHSQSHPVGIRLRDLARDG